MREARGRCYAWLGGGLVVGFIVGLAGVALAKLQCPSDMNVGRKHAVVPISATVDGAPLVIPSSADEPLLGKLFFKTELNDYPSLVHVDLFDPGATGSARILHFTRDP